MYWYCERHSWLHTLRSYRTAAMWSYFWTSNNRLLLHSRAYSMETIYVSVHKNGERDNGKWQNFTLHKFQMNRLTEYGTHTRTIILFSHKYRIKFNPIESHYFIRNSIKFRVWWNARKIEIPAPKPEDDLNWTKWRQIIRLRVPNELPNDWEFLEKNCHVGLRGNGDVE